MLALAEGYTLCSHFHFEYLFVIYHIQETLGGKRIFGTLLLYTGANCSLGKTTFTNEIA